MTPVIPEKRPSNPNDESDHEENDQDVVLDLPDQFQELNIKPAPVLTSLRKF